MINPIQCNEVDNGLRAPIVFLLKSSLYIFMIYLFFIFLTYLSLYTFIIFYSLFIILSESFRIPFDLPEAESELVAGFITEYAAILFSLILLTEYTNIIFISYLMIIFICFYCIFVLGFIFMIAIIRSAFNRILYDEMMTIC